MRNPEKDSFLNGRESTYLRFKVIVFIIFILLCTTKIRPGKKIPSPCTRHEQRLCNPSTCTQSYPTST